MRELHINQSITPRDSQALGRYFNDIAHSKPLTPDEEVELAFRIRQGDVEARNQLVQANLRFVISIAKQYQNVGIPLDDIINEGNIGLIRAAERFDPTRGFKFDTVAVWWIRQAITSSLGDHLRIVRMPMNVVTRIGVLKKVASKFMQQNQRQPSPEELAEMADMSVEQVRAVWESMPTVTSLDAPLSDDSDSTIEDVLCYQDIEPADAQLMNESLQMDIERVLAHLSDRDASIIRLSYGLDGRECSLDDLAQQFHLTRERVRQVRENALNKIRQSHAKVLCQYVR
ncbi:MAG: sigma-70 family RNA polymerase sigma factor [Paludibacteraceae bacterium]|nr:sigma-70 family RNA polymerase sigma factor [Paludibacteraceae bacterium]